MAFTDSVKANLKPQYTSNLATEFYQPLLREANLYQRVSGYFSTSGTDLYADGLEALMQTGGRVEFIISKEISAQDFQRIKAGYDYQEQLKTLRFAERNEKLTADDQIRLGNLAFMIASGLANVKVALTESGLFHDKFGLITSGDEQVFFNGSANETRSGISQNYESISVDVSWDSSSKVSSRIQANAERFQRLWNDQEPNVKVVEASQLTYDEIAKYQVESTIPPVAPVKESAEPRMRKDTIYFYLLDNVVFRDDNTDEQICFKDRKLRPGSDISHFFEEDNKTVRSTTTYKDLERIIQLTQLRAERRNLRVAVSPAVEDYIRRNKYSIEQYKIMGEVYKGKPDQFPQIKRASFEEFQSAVQAEVTRPLRPLHIRAAYYEYEMARAANFSVPGAGKTAMLLGVFAFLNRQNAQPNEKIDRLLVICPINAFESWRSEFIAVFGDKKRLNAMDCQSSKNFSAQVLSDWGVKNLVLINYEALPGYVDELHRMMDNRTMLVFDEVHRIKNPVGKRAQAALSISGIPQFRYVLTGTPIPNTYQDVYNFLHILYGNEYGSFFGWDPTELVNPTRRKIDTINTKLHPFFWRTNKNDLQVPPADPDELIVVDPSPEQTKLAEAIYANEASSLAVLIRLIQASTNPGLLQLDIDYDELMAYDEEGDTANISKEAFNTLLEGETAPLKPQVYDDLGVQSMLSPKFTSGIELVLKLVSEGKKVMVWAIFVDTLQKIASALRQQGIQVNLVYGATDKSERVTLINDFRDGNVQVLVSNPQTLGESISLHQSVHDAVYFEYNFNLTFMLQSRDRIHRLGLESTQYTRYYYLQTRDEDAFSVLPGFIDQKIYTRLKEKEQVMYSAIDDDTLSIEYSEDEIQEAIKIISDERRRITGKND